MTELSVKLPKPRISVRERNDKVFQKLRDMGKSNIVSIIGANRINSSDNIDALFKPSLGGLNLHLMKDIDKASDRISQAIIDGETIALCVDFDVDGISSGVVLYLALTEYMGCPPEKVRIHVNNRLEYGYGFNSKALKALLTHDPKDIPTLVITADQGSNDNETVREYHAFMDKKGIKGASVIVSDHHHIQEGLECEDAYAFVNPQRKDCQFPDKTICGCVVALFMMVMTREALNEKRKAAGVEDLTPHITPLLTYACMATIADCVSLKSEINRFIIRKGKHDINHGALPALQVIRENLKAPGSLITTTDIGFSLAPRINADSRTGGDGSTSINFLLSKTLEEARANWEKLTKRNNARKDDEKVMLNDALIQASGQYYEEGRRGLVIFLPKGSHGIHGIVASRIKERFNCPTIIFSPNNLDDREYPKRLLSGSGRSIDGIAIDSVLLQMQTEMTFKFGGHPMALGAKINQSLLKKFSKRFDELVKQQAKDKAYDAESFFFPEVYIDHIMQDDDLKWLNGLEILSEINSLDPYGQKFVAPCFGLNVRLASFSLVGANKTHVRINFVDTVGRSHQAMFFNYTSSPIYGTLKIGDSYTIAVDLQYNDYFKKLGMIIQAVEKGFNAVS